MRTQLFQIPGPAAAWVSMMGFVVWFTESGIYLWCALHPHSPYQSFSARGNLGDKTEIAVCLFCSFLSSFTRQTSLWSYYVLVINGRFQLPWELVFSFGSSDGKEFAAV